ncbi:hypothetical protein [Streptomyces sp. PvR018]|uniref:hypothetical protein n=1 Tax=Streptomyces sp. PvR018 TaxID=3156442 RepID=UPI0033979258
MPPRLATHQGLSAEEILYTLYGRRTVPLYRIGLVVITGTYTPRAPEPDWPHTPGEILVVEHTQDGSRELLAPHRDPYTAWEDATWCTHGTDDLESALELAELVTSDRPRGYYTWTEDGWSYEAEQDVAHRRWAGDPDGYARVDDHARGNY